MLNKILIIWAFAIGLCCLIVVNVNYQRTKEIILNQQKIGLQYRNIQGLLFTIDNDIKLLRDRMPWSSSDIYLDSMANQPPRFGDTTIAPKPKRKHPKITKNDSTEWKYYYPTDPDNWAPRMKEFMPYGGYEDMKDRDKERSYIPNPRMDSINKITDSILMRIIRRQDSIYQEKKRKQDSSNANRTI